MVDRRNFETWPIGSHLEPEIIQSPSFFLEVRCGRRLAILGADLEFIATINDSQNKALPFVRSRKQSTAKISPVSAERSYLGAKIALN
jgi:hypothetical protein